MEQWLIDLLNLYPDDGNWSKRRRMIILARWPDGAVRAAEQDARNARPQELARYDAEVVAIKAAIPKENA
jgi:hypothetical protein